LLLKTTFFNIKKWYIRFFLNYGNKTSTRKLIKHHILPIK
jgi:hypothetical protein